MQRPPEPASSQRPRSTDSHSRFRAHILRIPPHLHSRRSEFPHGRPLFIDHQLRQEKLRVEPAGNRSRPYVLCKRAIDVLVALFAIALFLPVLAPVVLLLVITTRGRPIFWQERVGYCGRRFRMFKFRTMVPNAEAIQVFVGDEIDGPVADKRHDARVTRLGRFLRRSSIDELPQLFNVLLGHMSLVGPRPHPVRQVAGYRAWHLRRLSVLPGLTCLWQVSGRSDINFDQNARMDLWYIRNQGLWTDFKLLLRTPWSVITMRGAY